MLMVCPRSPTPRRSCGCWSARQGSSKHPRQAAVGRREGPDQCDGQRRRRSPRRAVHPPAWVAHLSPQRAMCRNHSGLVGGSASFSPSPKEQRCIGLGTRSNVTTDALASPMARSLSPCSGSRLHDRVGERHRAHQSAARTASAPQRFCSSAASSAEDCCAAATSARVVARGTGCQPEAPRVVTVPGSAAVGSA